MKNNPRKKNIYMFYRLSLRKKTQHPVDIKRMKIKKGQVV